MPPSRSGCDRSSSPILPASASAMSIARPTSARAREASTATTSSITTRSTRRSADARISSASSPRCAPTAWDTSSTSFRIMSASWGPTMPGGWMCSRTARPRGTPQFFDIDWQPREPGARRQSSGSGARRSYGRVLERGELELRFDRRTARSPFSTTSTAFRSIRVPIPCVLERALELEPRKHCAMRIARRVREPDRRLRPSARAAGALARGKARGTPARRGGAQAPPCAGCSHAQSRADRRASMRRSSAVRNAGDASELQCAARAARAQAYRLASWRVASDEINYRRFFDVNDLAALRMENEAVFELRIGSALELLRTGQARRPAHRPSGWAIRPGAVFPQPAGSAPARPTAAATVRCRSTSSSRKSRPVSSGCRRLARARHDGLPLHECRERAVRRWQCARHVMTASTAHSSASLCEWSEWPTTPRPDLETSLSAELNVLANQLARIARADRDTRDFTFRTLRQALAELIACFPVYRTYVADVGLDRGSALHRLGAGERAAARSVNQLRRCSSSCVTALLVEGPASEDPLAARGARLRHEIPAGDRTGGGEGRRGHRALPLPPAGVA